LRNSDGTVSNAPVRVYHSSQVSRVKFLVAVLGMESIPSLFKRDHLIVRSQPCRIARRRFLQEPFKAMFAHICGIAEIVHAFDKFGQYRRTPFSG
jgi:hypothetical protein